MKKRSIISRKLFFFLTFSAILSGFSTLYAQSFKLYQHTGSVKVLNEAGDTMQNPWSGGMLSPMFSNIDLNSDGVQDLFVFDPFDSKISTFIKATNGLFVYAPSYESYFPPLMNFAFLVDYNKDNKPDIFAYSHEGGGIEVYKNETVGAILKFRKVSGLLRFPPQDINIYNSPVDIPSILDIDGDGDIDILALDVFQGNVVLFKNLSFEKTGKYDSLIYNSCDFCWGKFSEPTNSNIPNLGQGCGPNSCKTSSHGGFTLLALDADGDGDKDLIQGDLTSNTIILLKNGRIDNGQTKHPVDSMIAIDTLYPSAATRANLPGFLMPSYVDVNNDSKRDLIISPLNPLTNLKQVLLYTNNGADNNPSFQFTQNDFLQSNMIDLGQRAAPAFFDEDGDGDLDMVIATLGDFRQTGHKYERLVLYKNTGSKLKPVYRKEDDDYLGLSAKKLLGIAAAFGDMDKDGKNDLLLGNNNGSLIFFKNNAPVGQKANFSLMDTVFAGIDVGSQSTPAIIDFDRDGFQDLFVGEQNGNINYYRNDGSAFSLITDSVGKIKTNRSYYDYEYDNDGNIIDSTLTYEIDGFSAPVLADINADGKWDLFTGALSGNVLFYNNIEDNINVIAARDTFQFNSFMDTPENKNLGKITLPALADLNGDSIPELVVGNERGGLYLYVNKKEVITLNTESTDKQLKQQAVFRIYPVPASEKIYISYGRDISNNEVNNVELQLRNVLGQLIINKDISNFSGKELLDINGIKSGIYILQISNSGGVIQNEKIIIE